MDLKLAIHATRLARSRAYPKQGSNMAISKEIIDITTSSSINVNAFVLSSRIAKAPFTGLRLLKFPEDNLVTFYYTPF
jgi:hypothetical protein